MGLKLANLILEITSLLLKLNVKMNKLFWPLPSPWLMIVKSSSEVLYDRLRLMDKNIVASEYIGLF